VACYQKDGHPHKMEKLGFDLDGGGGDAAAANNPQVSLHRYFLYKFSGLDLIFCV
jgi:hypothetical protein